MSVPRGQPEKPHCLSTAIGVDSARSTGQDPTSAEKWSGPPIDGPDQVFGTVRNQTTDIMELTETFVLPNQFLPH